MTDTARSLGAILALLPDNTAGDISPQDVRDWAVSIPDLRSWVPGFNFAALPAALAGGNLTGGNGATITFTTANPCPWGMNGTDVAHYIYISGGTGTAEARLITGGTAVAGGTGTITFTPLNNHTGAYTITSASGGIAEQQQQYPTFPAICQGGTTILYAPLNPPALTVGIWGKPGLPGNCTLNVQFTGASIITLSHNQSFSVRDLTVTPGAGNMTTGYAVEQTNAGTLGLSNVVLGANGASAAVYKGFLGRGNVYVDHLTTVSTFAGFDLIGAYCEIDGCHILSNKDKTNLIANSYSWSVTTMAGGFINKVIHDTGYFAYGPRLDSTGTICNELFINDCYDDHHSVAGLITVGAGASQVAAVFINNLRLVDDATVDASGFITTELVISAEARVFNFTGLQIVYCLGTGISIATGAEDISISSPIIKTGDASGGVSAITITGATKRVSILNPTIAAGAAPAIAPVIGIISVGASEDLSIVGGSIAASSQANKIILSGSEVRPKVSGVSGIGNVRKTAASAATFTFPLMEDNDVLEITGTTDLTTVAGLREGQKGMIVCTDAGSLANLITQGNNIGSPTYTPVRYTPFSFFFSNSVFYAGNT